MNDSILINIHQENRGITFTSNVTLTKSSGMTATPTHPWCLVMEAVELHSSFSRSYTSTELKLDRPS